MDGWKHRLTDSSVLVALLGLVFVIGGVTFWYVELVPGTEALHAVLFDLTMHVLFGGVILVLGVHIERSDLPAQEQFTVIVWCYGGFLLMFVLSVWGHLGPILDGELPSSFVSDFLVFSSLGGAFGVIAGVNRGRAIRNETLAEKNREQSETLALLARLLSHDIRNDMTIIQSYAELLTDHVTDEGKSHIELIQERVQDAIRLMEDANALVKSLDEKNEFRTISLSAVLMDEVRTVRENHPAVDVQTDIPKGIEVEGNELIHQLFSNLLQNAVFHNDVTDLTISVAAERTAESVEVIISDNGKGIPPEKRETYFELGEQGPESGGDGIGLYLVSRLTEIYGGTIAVDESPTGGARFRISLPAVER